MNRRHFIKCGSATVASLAGFRVPAVASHAATNPAYPPIRTITHGPRHHWFGYYDKLQFDPSNRFVLSNQVNFEHRTPRPDDTIQVGMVDTQVGDRWIELGESRAWGWQQGCMLQWFPGTQHEVIWNDRQDDRFVSHVLNVKTKAKRTLENTVYTLSPDGLFGLTADFARIQIMRRGYGYVGLPDPFDHQVAPRDSGVFKVDLQTGKSELVLSLSEIATIPHQGKLLTGVKHYFNHLLVSPDSKRFIALHRWRKFDETSQSTKGGFTTRMITANVDGSDVFVLDPSGRTSHFIWRDPEHVCMWTRPEENPDGFYLYKDKTRTIKPVGKGVMNQNGHNTYLPLTGGQWILNDTYPDKQRNQNPYLFHVPSDKAFELGAFHVPESYKGEWRCDTHPRSSNDGRTICIDSPHAGGGRQLHLIDVGQIIDSVSK